MDYLLGGRFTHPAKEAPFLSYANLCSPQKVRLPDFIVTEAEKRIEGENLLSPISSELPPEKGG